MKLLLVVQREAGTLDCLWVAAAADEYTLDEHNGTPSFIQEALDVDPTNTRLLWVELPDDSLERAFRVPTVKGDVEDVCTEGNCGNPLDSFGLCIEHLAELPDSAFKPRG